MKKNKLNVLYQRNESTRQRRNFLFLLSMRRRYENRRTVAKENDSTHYDTNEEKVHECSDNIEKRNERHNENVNDMPSKKQEDILKYYDHNKNVIRTTNYILREHLNDIIFINQRNLFYSYFYNAYPFVVNKYMSQIKGRKQKNGLIQQKNSKENDKNIGHEDSGIIPPTQVTNNSLTFNNNQEMNPSLGIFHYYNTNTKHEMEEDNFIHLISQKVNCLNSASKFLKDINDNFHLAHMKNTDLYKLGNIFQNIIERINDTNDINKKIEILLYLSNVCNPHVFPSIYANVKKYIQEIYEHIKKKTKKGVDESYILFLLYKQFLSKKNDKYVNMNVEKYLSEEISFYNYLKNENINICLLSLIYRDLSFLKNYQAKFVLMNLAFSKMKNSDFFTRTDTPTGSQATNTISRIRDSNNQEGSKDGHLFNPTKGNAHVNLLLTFFSNTLLRNNFLHFLQNDYINLAQSSINYTNRVNQTNVNNYILYNLVISIVQMKASQSLCYETILKKKMHFFLQNKKNTMLFHQICKMKKDLDHMNDFILNNIIFFTPNFVKHRINIPRNMYLYILNIYCDLFDMMKSVELYTDIKKKKHIINDSKKIINYIINEIYQHINMYTLKEFVILCAMIDKLPRNFTFELRNDNDHLSHRMKNNLYKKKQDEMEEALIGERGGVGGVKARSSHLQHILHFPANQVIQKRSKQIAEKKYTTQDEQNRQENIKRDVRGDDLSICNTTLMSNQKTEDDMYGRNKIENIAHTSEYISNKNVGYKMKKKMSIISKHDFTIIISLSIFNEINDNFIFQIKQKEFHETNVTPLNCDDIFDYVYKKHYEQFLNNSDFYINFVTQNYDSATVENIINYFIFCTHINQLDMSDLCVLIRIMKQINKFHSFIDFYMAKRVEKMLKEEYSRGREQNLIGNETEKRNSYEFTDTYLDEYISKINEKKKKVDQDIFSNAENNNKSITESEISNMSYVSQRMKHFDEMNLNTHSLYAANFEKYYYDYDICNTAINMFLSLHPMSQTRRVISNYHPYFTHNKVNIFKINMEHFFVNEKDSMEKNENSQTFHESYHNTYTREANIEFSNLFPNETGKNSQMVNSEQENYPFVNSEHENYPFVNSEHENYPFVNSEHENYPFVNSSLSSQSMIIDNNNYPFSDVQINSNLNWKKKVTIYDHPFDHDLIYNIVEERLKYNINVKNYLLNKMNENNEETKNFLEKEVLSLNNIACFIYSINTTNDDMKYMKLLNLALKDIILSKHEIVDIKIFRMITKVLVDIKNVYQNIYFPSEYSYLSMLTKHYVQIMQNFFPFFKMSDYFQIIQIFIKYNLTENYLKNLVSLNRELNKMNMKNFNINLIHIILYFYTKLGYMNEKFISNILQMYAHAMLQQINNINKHIVENLIKTNDLLLSLCIKNRDIIQLNYLLIQHYSDYSREFKIDDYVDEGDEARCNTPKKEENNLFSHGNNMKNKDVSSKSFDVNNNKSMDRHTENTKFVKQNESEEDVANQDLYVNFRNENIFDVKKKLIETRNSSSNVWWTHNNHNICSSNDRPTKNKCENKTSDIEGIKEKKEITTSTIFTKKCQLSLKQKLKIMYFLCKFHLYNDLIKIYYLQLLDQCIKNKNDNLNDEDYCKLYEIYVHVILNFYFLSFNKNNKYINFVLNNLPCYYWYKREEEKLNLFISSKEFNDIHLILKLLNIDFLTPTLTEIYFIHFFNDIKKTNHALEIPINVLHLYKKFNLLIDDVRSKSISILCVPEEDVLWDDNGNNRILINESHYVYENIKKTYATSLLFLSEWKKLNTEEKCEYILRVIHSSLNS
ncbi:hypothetical protein, conserved [Plasmodium gonderi]|uniref:Uncharacterized protein n=1 Tax=Plasmodium gonderi TaxID=77519 RepID=A0A1Y1JHU0_PLAGO|nr:hypothetical protein, conserved [Plasmodium gonderi]GAW82096.1 hypothetical protein, conserved [Plasmodium gonderi]